MGQRINVEYFDDLAPDEPATTTVRFAHDGARYEVDVSTERARELADLLAPYIAAGRKAGTAPANSPVGASTPARASSGSSGRKRASGGGSSARTSAPGDGAYRAARAARAEWRRRVHAWAEQTGYPEPGTPSQGRLSDALAAAYVAANPDDPEVPAPGSTAGEARRRGVIA